VGPDGKFLYFSSNRGGGLNLWRIAIDEESGRTGGAPEAVASGGSASRMHMSISKDGKRIVYVERISNVNLSRLNFDPTSEKVQGTPVAITTGNRTVGIFGGPQISPDGQLIAYVMGGAQEDLYIMRSDGSSPVQLTNDAFRDRYPMWAPDSKRIAFTSNRSGTYALYTINRDGSGLLKMADSGVITGWSPDGKRAFYNLNRIIQIVRGDLPGDAQKL
jgi:Tol biopolymer transport system component